MRSMKQSIAALTCLLLSACSSPSSPVPQVGASGASSGGQASGASNGMSGVATGPSSGVAPSGGGSGATAAGSTSGASGATAASGTSGASGASGVASGASGAAAGASTGAVSGAPSGATAGATSGAASGSPSSDGGSPTDSGPGTLPDGSINGVPAGYKGTPYNGVKAQIPGTIYARNYDVGGQGIAFNHPGATNCGDWPGGMPMYRTGADCVGLSVENAQKPDVTVTGAPANYGEIYISYCAQGEWLNYTV